MKKGKALNVKVPKRIAGVKIPKTVRKGPVADFLNSSGGQVLIAEALLLAARSYAGKRVDPDSPVGEFINHPTVGQGCRSTSGQRRSGCERAPRICVRGGHARFPCRPERAGCGRAPERHSCG
jgi:hypothetical protein